ncbi:MAG TPA: hypothetical protein VMD30_09065 [Tepidisphaeraceae bacterium]|nr:hypothetical protein [Tepidisphaeraceae bacterium]
MKWTLLAAFLLLTGPALADEIPATMPSLWDPSRYMAISDVRPGMTGYGLTVFSGSTISRFNVRVVDVISNFRPKGDLILITSDDPRLLHSESVEGMSGSPIFLYATADTKHLHPLLAGAFAYAWAQEKDPLAGVQPIQYMMDIPKNWPPKKEQTASISGGGEWNLNEVLNPPNRHQPQPQTAGPMLRMLATPVVVSGLTHQEFEQIAPDFNRTGLVLMEGGGGGAGDAGGDVTSLGDINAPLAPGSSLVVPLLTGDAEADAIGTCTEIRGKRIFAFGHSFNNDGPIALPMGTGRISTIVADSDTSFKLGAFAKMKGVLTADEGMGVSGVMGPTPPMIPFTLRVVYTDGSLDQTYHFQMALHPKLTAEIAEMAVEAAMGAVKDPPDNHTLDYNIDMKFADGKNLKVSNIGINGGQTEIFQQIGLPLVSVMDNPFQNVAPTSISGTVRITPGDRSADITSITIPRLKYAPGEIVKGFVNYRPWQADTRSMTISFKLPKDLPDGQYQVVVSDWQQYFNDEQKAEPFRYTAENIDELFNVVKDYESMRHDAIYVRLVEEADGVAVGRSAMPKLPAAMRDVLLASGRSDMTPFVTSTTWTIPTSLVMSGAADFTLTVSRSNRVVPVRSGKQPASEPSAGQ